MKSVPSLLGKSLASLAGLVAVVAFLAFPWLSLGIFGNYTAAQVVQLAAQDLHVQQLTSLWLGLLFPLIAVVCVLLSCMVVGFKRLLALLVMMLGTIALLGALGLYVFVSRQNLLPFSLTEFIGSGFWIYTVSVALVAVGGVMQLVSPVPQKRIIVPNRRWDSTGVQRPDERAS